MDLNVSLGDSSRKNNETAAALAAGMNNSNSNNVPGDVVSTMVMPGSATNINHVHHHQNQQQQKKRKANRDSWPFMHAIMLLECFKEVWTKSNMGNLTMAQWTEVSNRVNTSCGINMNEQQCRTKVDNLKKRYKRERMKYAPTGHTSPWEFYGVMNKLFGNTTKLSTAGASPVSGNNPSSLGGGDDTEGSEEDDVVVLDNGGDLIFGNIGTLSTSPQAASSFGRGLLMEGPESTVLDASPNGNNSNAAADGTSFQDAGFPSSSNAVSPRSGSVKRLGRSGKRKRDSVGTTESYGELIKEVEKERNSDWQKKWVELSKVDKKRIKSLARPQETARSIRLVMEGASYDHFEGDELDDEEERTRDDFRMKSLYAVEHKVELATKALADAQDEKERLEGDLQVAKEVLDQRKALSRALKFCFKKAFLEKMIPAETINISLSKFPYHLSDITRDLLVEAVAGCVGLSSKRSTQLSGLCSSNHLILLNGPRNSAIYQETLVKALAHDQGMGLLVLESTDLAPQDYGDDSEPNESSKQHINSSRPPLRKGDRVVCRLNRNREEKSRQERRRGRVIAVSKNVAGKIGIVFDKGLTIPEDALKLTNRIEELRRGDVFVEWHYASDFEKDQSVNGSFVGEWHASLSALCEIGRTAKPFIVFLPEVEQWFQRAVPPAWKYEFLDHVQKQLDKLYGNVVFIASCSSYEDDPFTGISCWKKQRSKPIYALFPNVVDIFPPKDDSECWRWKMQLLQDGERLTCNLNIQIIQKVLLYHNVTCLDVVTFQVCDFVLTESEAESLTGWAITYEYANSRNIHPERKLQVSAGSLERALLKLRRLKQVHGYKGIAKDEYEETVLLSASSPETKFEDVGALDDVKKVLEDIVVLPLVRPELFTKGALACCKGVLLYGPPGTGKTLLAKAVAAEASASLIWLRGSSIDYKWLEDPKGMTKALFSVSRKLAPCIIFLDEVDAIFGIQGSEAMNRFKFEFMSWWDKCLSRAGDQVLVMAATCRPFDLDEPVIQKFQKRICVGLPDPPSREKILHVLLAKELVDTGLNCKGVAGLTEGYSGCDLKNLTIAAACRQVREMLELEKGKNNTFDSSPQELRPLTTEDLIAAMEEVVATYNTPYLEQLRQWDEQYGMRRW